MSYRAYTPDSWIGLCGGIGLLIFVVSLCSWISLAVWHTIHTPPQPYRPQTSQQLYEQCERDVEQNSIAKECLPILQEHLQ